MSRTTRLLLAGTALLLAGCGVWFGLTPKAIHIAECGSPFHPEKAGLSSEAAEECAFALDKRYAVLWWVFIAAAVLGPTAVVGGRFTRAPHAEDPGVAKRS